MIYFRLKLEILRYLYTFINGIITIIIHQWPDLGGMDVFLSIFTLTNGHPSNAASGHPYRLPMQIDILPSLTATFCIYSVGQLY